MPSSKRARLGFHAFRLTLAFLLIGGSAWFSFSGAGGMDLKQIVSWPALALLLLVHAANYFCLGIAQNLPLRQHGVRLAFREWFGLTVIANLLNLLLPAKAGNGARYAYLRERYEIGLGDFVQMSLSVSFVALWWLSALGLVYFFAFTGTVGSQTLLFRIVLSVMFVVSTFAIYAPAQVNRLLPSRIALKTDRYLSDRRIYWGSTAALIGVKVLYPLKIYLAFKALGFAPALAQSYEISLSVLIVSLFPVLPGNLGVKEFATGFIAHSMGIPLKLAIAASLLERMSYGAFLIPVGLAYWAQLFGRATVSNSTLEKPSQTHGVATDASQVPARKVNLKVGA